MCTFYNARSSTSSHLQNKTEKKKHIAKLHDNQSASMRRADSGRTRMCTEENAIRVLRVRRALLRSVATLSSHEADARACAPYTKHTTDTASQHLATYVWISVERGRRRRSKITFKASRQEFCSEVICLLFCGVLCVSQVRVFTRARQEAL